jgi:RHH-type proline utilization regulon transcriptional repressor/proline dehydrogenase/delta 1-pyrroline-5-carboxylate dehydrogenase
MQHEFGIGHDPSALDCETNLFRYRRFERCLIRGSETISDADLARLLLAATAAGVKPELSLPPGREFAVPGVATWHESVEALCRRLGTAAYGVLRTVSPPEILSAAAVEAGIRLVGHAPVLSGKLELPAYFREQAISETKHRHGSVLPRPQDLR